MSNVNYYEANARQLEVLGNERAFIPDDIFPVVRKWSATPTADFVCAREKDGVTEFLLTRRTEKPWQGDWFVPGGRIRPGEHPQVACARNCKRELGFDPRVESMKFVDWFPLLNPEDQYGGEPYFTQMTVFKIFLTAEESERVVLDRTANEFRWFRANEPFLPAPVREILSRCGF